MRRNSESHLDDIASRFAATSRRVSTELDQDQAEFDSPKPGSSGRARSIMVVVGLLLLGAAAVIGLLIMRG